MLDILLNWLIDPLMDFLERRHTSGKWHVVYLLPVATIACVGLCFLAKRWNSVVLLVFGALGAVMFGLFSIFSWIPREIEADKDLKSYIAEKAQMAEELQENQISDNEQGT